MKYEVTLSVATITLKTYFVEADTADEAEDLACDMEDVNTPPGEVSCVSHDREVVKCTPDQPLTQP